MVKRHLLIIDDDSRFIEDFILLGQDLFTFTSALTGEEALKRIQKQEPDAVILDLCLGAGMDGLQMLQAIRKKHGDLPVIMVTEHASVETAVEAMKLGALHYMSKHPNMEALGAMIEKELGQLQWKRLYEETVQSQFGEIIGESPVMKAVYKRIGQVAKSSACILIEGESGTGKEIVAREIHKRSPRSGRPFIAVNCAAIPPSLFESELFGHEKGAFTGAVNRRQGRFEQAHGGTLFLDEISSLSLEFQAKLLRVLEERTFTRVGGNDLIHVDVRILSATNRPLAMEVRRGAFREDLFHRVNGIDIPMPPLRERGDDILLLALHFYRQFCNENQIMLDERFSQASIRALGNYMWPGNVRELRNVMERAFILVVGRLVETTDLQLQPSTASNIPAPFQAVLTTPYEKAKTEIVGQFKKHYLSVLLDRCNGDVAAAAREAGLSRQSLYRMLNE